MLLHAFRLSSFSIDRSGGCCGESALGGSQLAGLASVKKEKNVEVVDFLFPVPSFLSFIFHRHGRK